MIRSLHTWELSGPGALCKVSCFIVLLISAEEKGVDKDSSWER